MNYLAARILDHRFDAVRKALHIKNNQVRAHKHPHTHTQQSCNFHTDGEILGAGVVLTEDLHSSFEPFWKLNSDLSFRPAVGAHLRACAEGAGTDVPAREGGTALTRRLLPLMQSAESAAQVYLCSLHATAACTCAPGSFCTLWLGQSYTGGFMLTYPGLAGRLPCVP